MEYLPAKTSQSQQIISCCLCGAKTEPNPSNMCVGCIRSKVDITEGIPKQAYLNFCKSCERYLQPPSNWVQCTLESRELLSVCMKRLKNLSKVRLVDAGFIWTEPHSKRLKVKLTIQKEVLNSTILEQSFVVEFIVQNQMCDMCHRKEAHDFWKAVVQIRQKVHHRKTFFYLEQLIIKHNAHVSCISIKQNHDGLDFYYAKREEARKLVDFLMTVVPCRYKTSEQLISHDIHNNTYNYKHTFSVELVPICKDDIVCLPQKLARSMGNMGQIAICYKVTNGLYFIDPTTLQTEELLATSYWRTPFNSLCTSKQLTEYTVLEGEPVVSGMQIGGHPSSRKFGLADVYVMRTHDMGVTDDQIHCRTHLGYFLNAGDSALGFDFTSANLNDENLEKMKSDKVRDVVLVKKSFGDEQRRRKKRNWKLKSLAKEGEDSASANRDYDDFLDELEEDKEYRQNIHIYKDHSRHPTQSESESDDLPRIGIEEMLDDLTLEDQDMASDSD